MEYNRFICNLKTKMHHFSNITMQYTHNWLKTNAWIIHCLFRNETHHIWGIVCVCVRVCVCVCVCGGGGGGGGIVNVRIIIMNLQKGETMSMYFGDHYLKVCWTAIIVELMI